MPSSIKSEFTESDTKPADGITGFFDRTLNNFREQVRTSGSGSDRNARAQRWAQMIHEAGKLRDRIRSDDRVLYFDFNHDHEELSVKIADPSRQSHAYFILSRHDPDTLELPPLECVWLRQIGEPDVVIELPMDSLRELAVRIARLLV